MVHDVAVVGGGIVGAACAFHLRQAGLAVVLIDHGIPSHAASWGNAGHFAYEQIFPLATPGLWRELPRLLLARDSPLSLPLSSLWTLAPWLARFAWNTRPSQVRHATGALASLLTPAPDAWQRLASAARLHSLIRTGPLLVAARNADALASRRPVMDDIRRHGIEVEEIDPAAARAIEPMLRADIAGAFAYPRGQYTVDPAKLTGRLIQAGAEAGVEVVHHAVESIERLPDATLRVAGGLKSWVARKCVVAAGIGSGEILGRLGIKVPLAAERGYHLMVPYASGRPRIRVPIIGAKPEFVITPMEEGVRLAGTVEIARPDRAPNWRRAQMLKRLAGELIEPLEVPEDASQWIGCRPSLPDSLPVIGGFSGFPNLIGAFGHQHLGLTLAAITGEIVCAMVQGRTLPVPIAPFSFDRF